MLWSPTVFHFSTITDAHVIKSLHFRLQYTNQCCHQMNLQNEVYKKKSVQKKLVVDDVLYPGYPSRVRTSTSTSRPCPLLTKTFGLLHRFNKGQVRRKKIDYLFLYNATSCGYFACADVGNRSVAAFWCLAGWMSRWWRWLLECDDGAA